MSVIAQMPGGLSTGPANVQTGKIRDFPVVLYNSAYWRGLLDWLRSTMLANRKISSQDLDIMQLVDSPEVAARIIVDTVSRG